MQDQFTQMCADVAHELTAQGINQDTIDKALDFIGSYYPTVAGLENPTKFALMCIACYNAGMEAGKNAKV